MVFVAAEAREFGGLLPFCRNVERLDWRLDWARVAELNGRKVFLAANGAGPKRAAEAIEFVRSEVGNRDMDAVVSTGYWLVSFKPPVSTFFDVTRKLTVSAY